MKIIKLLFFISCFYPLVLMASNSNKVSGLKTFFTSAGERSKLDELRASGAFDKKFKSGVMPDNASSQTSKIEMKGIMIKKNGDAVVWVNEANTLKSNRINQQITVKKHSANKGRINVSIQSNNKKMKMKPGQQWNTRDGLLNDTYQVK